MSDLTFSFKDLYPDLSGEETGERAIPDEDKQKLMSEQSQTADEAGKKARPKFIFLALGLIAALVVFYGVGEK